MNSKANEKSFCASRREFLKTAAVAGAGALGFPTILPSHVFGKAAPSNLIQVAQIGCGRIARDSEFPGVLKHSELARFVAVCDLDTVRIGDARELLETYYAKKFGSGKYAAIKSYRDYREMLQDKSIDAVCISTPDHWHAQPAIEAALAGKDIYLQKPASLTIVEGRQMADIIKKTGRILQIGSQQRSGPQFRLACEAVRNGRLGKLKEIFIGLPVDPSGEEEPEMPVPGNLNYEAWLGSTPLVYYTEKRVHPQANNLRARYDRPGWLRCQQFGAGMITGWGAHHIDTAHWAMGTALTGPIEVTGKAEFPKKGLWDVHGPYQIEAKYANGVVVHISDKYPNGLKFIGEAGWLWVSRGDYQATASDPVSAQKNSKALDASDRKIISPEFRPDEVRLHASPRNDHHLDWLTSIRTRKEPVAPAEEGHRACTACLVADIAMKLGRTLTWDPEKERFVNDAQANGMLSRRQRAPYGTDAVLAKL